MASVIATLLNRKGTIISLFIITPLGFYTKVYSGPAALWVNNSLGGVLYVVFWVLVVFAVMPKINPFKIAASVLIVTCGLEILQLWHPLFLEQIRKYFLGRALLGTTFVWLDIFHYFIGFGISSVLLIVLHRIEFTKSTQSPEMLETGNNESNGS